MRTRTHTYTHTHIRTLSPPPGLTPCLTHNTHNAHTARSGSLTTKELAAHFGMAHVVHGTAAEEEAFEKATEKKLKDAGIGGMADIEAQARARPHHHISRRSLHSYWDGIHQLLYSRMHLSLTPHVPRTLRWPMPAPEPIPADVGHMSCAML